MIDIRKLKELVRLMVDNDLTELDLRDEQETVMLKRPSPNAAPLLQHGPAGQGGAAPAAAEPAVRSIESAPVEPAAEDDGLLAIESPMVGTFYSAPDPESPPYVLPGSQVHPDSVVCIVEAMKVFSEIKAECTGAIEKVLVKTGEPVEYGQRLFLVRPA